MTCSIGMVEMAVSVRSICAVGTALGCCGVKALYWARSAGSAGPQSSVGAANLRKRVLIGPSS